MQQSYFIKGFRGFYPEDCRAGVRLHFLDGSQTDGAFDLDRDDPAVLAWIGLSALRVGERQWLDLSAQTELRCALKTAMPR
jgi:hypothetical protein